MESSTSGVVGSSSQMMTLNIETGAGGNAHYNTVLYEMKKDGVTVTVSGLEDELHQHDEKESHKDTVVQSGGNDVTNNTHYIDLVPVPTNTQDNEQQLAQLYSV